MQFAICNVTSNVESLMFHSTCGLFCVQNCGHWSLLHCYCVGAVSKISYPFKNGWPVCLV